MEDCGGNTALKWRLISAQAECGETEAGELTRSQPLALLFRQGKGRHCALLSSPTAQKGAL